MVIVAFLLDEIVVLRFTVTFVEATGFLVVFITVDVAFFDGLNAVTGGRLDGLVGLTVVDPSVETDVVLLNDCDETGFLVELVGLVAGFLVL